MMARCLYCGKPAGFLRRQHPECEKRHAHTLSRIPIFFTKVMDNAISAEQFSELLQGAAQVSFVSSDEFKSLCASGINNIIDLILQERTLTSLELRRVMEITDALEVAITEGLGIEEKLIKVGILTELYEGKLSDSVVIVGPMPIEIGKGEAVLWIFNHVRSYRAAVDEMNENLPINLTSPTDTHYFGPNMLKKIPAPKETLSEEANGDLILTNRNIYFLQSESSKIRIPISRIASLQLYAEGIHVGCKPADKRSRTFLLDDAWFAANVIACLIQLARR